MKFELVSKSDEEVVDVLEMHDIDIKGAKAYFMSRKMLEEKDFDNLFRVKVNSPVNRPNKCWKEESTDLDDF